MHFFEYKDQELYCEDTKISEIAREIKTPFYLYSYATLERHFRVFNEAFNGIDHITCFSMKSNSNGAILRMFSRAGGGVDIVSGGELYRALRAGVSPDKIVYSGVGKTAEEIEYALKSGILMFNAESPQEIMRLDEVAGSIGKKARIAIRVNPDVDPQTHPYISTGLKENKFGIDINKSFDEYVKASKMNNIEVTGVSCHIGSQLTKVDPFVDALKKVKELIAKLDDTGIRIKNLDLGGGLGVTYDDEKPPLPEEYAAALKETLGDMGLTLILEPGRVIMANSGILVAKVLYTKANEDKNFAVVDAAMNDLARPSLYGSYHSIKPVKMDSADIINVDIVGPICESGDFLAKNREMASLKQEDLIAVMSAGAYGFTMSSSYNSRPRVAEVMVKGDKYYTIRERETFEDLVKGEKIPEFMK
ncbi:MAG: diaminopimelate decarboxylase [Desulfobacteraceae bacterium]|jgi:diaminopimelate decarboxylase